MNAKISTFFKEWRGFFLFVAIMLVFRSAIADWNHVPSGSMKPSILEGDRIIVDKLAYDLRVPFTLKRLARFHEPERGDIVTFPSPPPDERLFIKRVVGLPGDVVELRHNRLFINGEAATYTPLSEEDVDVIDLENKDRYQFLYEEILGNRRVIMLLNNASFLEYASFEAIEVPEDNYLMLGDNRDHSGDYRRISWIGRERILGRAHGIAFSWNFMELEAPRNRFFEELK